MSGFPLILLGQWDALWSRVDPGVRMGVPDLGAGDVPVVGGAVPDPGRMVMRQMPKARLDAVMRRQARSAAMTRDAGRNAHEAGAPTLIPVPSLLRSLLSEHLDPGYAAAAERERAGGARRAGRWPTVGWQAAGRAADRDGVRRRRRAGPVRPRPASRETQQVLAGSVRSAEAADGRRDRPPRRAGRRGRRRAAQPARGRRTRAGSCSAASTRPSFAAAATAVHRARTDGHGHRPRRCPRISATCPSSASRAAGR